MTKKILPLIFLALVYGGLVVANLYNSGRLSIQWAYLAIGFGLIAICVGFYGFISQTIPKFKSIYNRWFKKEETKTVIKREAKRSQK